MSEQMAFDFEDVYEKLLQAEIVKNQSELSRLMGMGRNYISNRKAKLSEPSTEAIMHLAFNLERQLQEFESRVRNHEDITEFDLFAASTLYEMQSELFDELREIVRDKHDDQSA